MDSVKYRELHSPQAAPSGAASVDAAQFAAIFDRCDKRIHGYILNKVRNPETAIDLAQEAFSKAWESRARFDPTQDELAWLITIASNVIADYFKYQNAQKRDPASGQMAPRGGRHFAVGLTLNTAARRAVDPAKEMIDAEQIAAVEAAIARLDPSKRQAIEFYQAGLSYDEIATRMRVRNGTVGSLISRATKELQKMFGAQAE